MSGCSGCEHCLRFYQAHRNSVHCRRDPSYTPHPHAPPFLSLSPSLPVPSPNADGAAAAAPAADGAKKEKKEKKEKAPKGDKVAAAAGGSGGGGGGKKEEERGADISRIDLRVGLIKKAWRHPDAERYGTALG